MDPTIQIAIVTALAAAIPTLLVTLINIYSTRWQIAQQNLENGRQREAIWHSDIAKYRTELTERDVDAVELAIYRIILNLRLLNRYILGQQEIKRQYDAKLITEQQKEQENLKAESEVVGYGNAAQEAIARAIPRALSLGSDINKYFTDLTETSSRLEQAMLGKNTEDQITLWNKIHELSGILYKAMRDYAIEARAGN